MFKRILSFVALMAVASAGRTDVVDSVKVDSLTRGLIEVYELEKNLTYQTGLIELRGGVATLNVPEGFKFLDAEQSDMVLTRFWGNPPSDNTLGMLFPENMTPLAGDLTFAVEITYSEDGYIKDDDARELDYDDLLDQMKKEAQEANKERAKLGYQPVELVGWAVPPFYDSETKKLHWAKELHFGENEENTLNYNIRILGREGVLVLNVISDMRQLDMVKPDVPTLLGSIDFNEGYRYKDFDPSIDKVAAYGVGGLIAGKVLAKTGFLAILAKFGKFIVIGLIAVFGAFRKFLFRKKVDAVAEARKLDGEGRKMENEH